MKNSEKNSQLCQTNVRQSAMDWWNKLEPNLNEGFSKWQLGYKYFNRHWMSFTGREIEIIYKCEHID